MTWEEIIDKFVFVCLDGQLRYCGNITGGNAYRKKTGVKTVENENDNDICTVTDTTVCDYSSMRPFYEFFLTVSRGMNATGVFLSLSVFVFVSPTSIPSLSSSSSFKKEKQRDRNLTVTGCEWLSPVIDAQVWGVRPTKKKSLRERKKKKRLNRRTKNNKEKHRKQAHKEEEGRSLSQERFFVSITWKVFTCPEVINYNPVRTTVRNK